CRVALVTTAGLRLESHEPFNNHLGLGDTTFREIPGDVDVADLIEDHSSSSFDHAGVQADRNIAFPLDRFRELETEGVIGSLNQRHFSFMGSIISASSLINETAPDAAFRLRQDKVDAVLLVPI
ncbi:MAG: glycine/betaine/sarcosine/D-proline family reductase selenoprotein B, partial [Acidobacteriota bacterium]|nr:glycine/betaine/sarcosine/D-proline family reductase selenoprotein B [Acidobacteriota bacterium]